MNKNSVILHIPHSSIFIPDEALHQYDTSLLEKEPLLMTDRYTNELFDLPYSKIVFPFSRLFCDVERFRDDSQEEMFQKGMGVVYTRTHENIEYRKITMEEKLQILEKFYDVHHKRFEELVDEKLAKYNEALIIDCHSFNPYPLTHENDKTERPEICIGVDKFHTDKALSESLINLFQEKNYTTKINSPFSGSIVPLRYYGKDKNVHSVMIEINRSLYMDSDGRKIKNFGRLKDDISDILSRLHGIHL